ncbi:peptidoglycan DD-metalloendopeptidase family protein, partial [Flavobacteriaceae bacterium]|nr:peptidoglycan DD-metalloendopeptidase family protein [Flavobacteriaceae bacterium]
NNIGYSKIYGISKEYREVFDVRRLGIGRPYTLLKSKDSLQSTQYFIYEQDAIRYAVIDFTNGVNVYKEEKPVKYVTREASGVITSSLSEAILDQGIDYEVTNNLSVIYAWTIDFFSLQKGDKFKVVYKEKFINDTIYAGAGPIESAYFEHNGKPFYAFRHMPDTVNKIVEYFDENGNNLRRAFLRAPVNFAKISSRYNLKRKIAFYGNKVRPHKGTDYKAAVGTEILATANGRVVESTRRGGNGKYVKIKHNNVYSTQYLHMKSQKVKKGDYVKQGDVIGWVGMTGNTSGPHVCYRFWKNGRQVDPLREKLPAAEPLPKSILNTYLVEIAPKKEQIDNINFSSQSLDAIATN